MYNLITYGADYSIGLLITLMETWFSMGVGYSKYFPEDCVFYLIFSFITRKKKNNLHFLVGSFL